MDLLAIPFMRHVLFAGVLVALGLAPLSVYVVLRRIVFVGAAVAEISSAGVALAVLLQYEPFAVALVLTVLTFLVLSRVADSPRLPPEALIGMLYAGGSAAAVLLIVKAPRGEADIVNVLFGNILTVPVPLLWTFLVLSRVADSPRLPLEALIGMLYAGGSAAAVLLIVKAPRGEADIVNVLFGNILTVPVPLLWTMLATFALVIALQYLDRKST